MPMGLAAAGGQGGSGEIFGQLLVHYRIAVGLSQRRLAVQSGLSERAVRDLERGAVARPRRESVRALARALGLCGDDLVGFVAAAEPTGRRSVPMDLSWPPASDLVGRRSELRALADLVTVARHRIITVTGPAGIGKSRLVAALVAAMRGPAGLAVYTVDLSGLSEPDLVGEVIAEAIGAPVSVRSAPVERIAVELGERRTVLVLDCFERLVDAAATVAALVRRCPGLTVLTTSRRRLDLSGERLLVVGPLPPADAVELFVRRAAIAVQGFALTGQNAAAIQSICASVNGLPLAVELAAARMRVLTPGELAARLDRPLQILTRGSRDAPQRHQSLRAAIESSLELLDDRSRTLLTWLAPFAGGVGLADLETVADRLAGNERWVVSALNELLDAGMLRADVDEAHSRYLLPDSVRQLADELPSARDDESAVRDAVASHYLHRLREAAKTADGRGFAGLDPDVDNVRAAVDRALAHLPAALDTATAQALYRFHDVRCRYVEGRATILRVARSGVDAAAVWALVAAANFSRLLKDPDDARELVGRAQALLSFDDHPDRAVVELLQGNLATDRGDMAAASAHNAAAAQSARIAGDLQVLGRALNNLGGVALVLGALRDAELYYRESLAVRRRSGSPDRDLGLTLMNLAELERTGRRWAAAIRHAREAAGLLARAGHPRWRAMALSTLAIAALRGGVGGDLDTAAGAIEEAVEVLPALGDDKPTYAVVAARHSVVLHARGRTAEAFPRFVEVAEAMDGTLAQFELAPIIEAHAALLARRDAAAAAQLLGLAQAVRDNQEHPQPGLLQPASRTAAGCRARLGAADYAKAHRSGMAKHRQGLADALAELLPAE